MRWETPEPIGAALRFVELSPFRGVERGGEA